MRSYWAVDCFQTNDLKKKKIGKKKKKIRCMSISFSTQSKTVRQAFKIVQSSGRIAGEGSR